MGREYEVVPIKKRSMLKGGMNAADLQVVLNGHAGQGWVHQHSITGETVILEKDVFLLIFCRES